MNERHFGSTPVADTSETFTCFLVSIPLLVMIVYALNKVPNRSFIQYSRSPMQCFVFLQSITTPQLTNFISKLILAPNFTLLQNFFTRFIISFHLTFNVLLWKDSLFECTIKISILGAVTFIGQSFPPPLVI